MSTGPMYVCRWRSRSGKEKVAVYLNSLPQKLKLSLPHVAPNLYDFLFLVKNKRYFENVLSVFVHTMEVIGTQCWFDPNLMTFIMWTKRVEMVIIFFCVPQSVVIMSKWWHNFHLWMNYPFNYFYTKYVFLCETVRLETENLMDHFTHCGC